MRRVIRNKRLMGRFRAGTWLAIYIFWLTATLSTLEKGSVFRTTYPVSSMGRLSYQRYGRLTHEILIIGTEGAPIYRPEIFKRLTISRPSELDKIPL